MKTLKLNKDFFASKEQYLDYIKVWKKLTTNKDPRLTSVDYLLHAALAGKDLGAGFTPITNPRYIPAKGPHKYWSLENTQSNLKFLCASEKSSKWQIDRMNKFLERYEGTISSEMLNDVVESIPSYKDWETI